MGDLPWGSSDGGGGLIIEHGLILQVCHSHTGAPLAHATPPPVVPPFRWRWDQTGRPVPEWSTEALNHCTDPRPQGKFMNILRQPTMVGKGLIKASDCGPQSPTIPLLKVERFSLPLPPLGDQPLAERNWRLNELLYLALSHSPAYQVLLQLVLPV